jgi:glycosyltransferase involved in cell wall biosynthesis
VAHVHHVFEGLTLSVVDVLLARRVPVVMTLHDYKPVCPNYRLYTGGRPCQRCLDGGYWNVVRHNCLEGSAWRGLAAAVDAYRRRLGHFWERVDLFVAPSCYLRDRVVAGGLPADRVTVVPNPVELPPAPPRAARPGPARFLYTGRLV